MSQLLPGTATNHDLGFCPCRCLCGPKCDHRTCPCKECVYDRLSRGRQRSEGRVYPLPAAVTLSGGGAALRRGR